MNTTAATYSIQVTTDEGHLSFLKDMPTRPKTHKGIKSQNNKLSKWVKNSTLTLHPMIYLCLIDNIKTSCRTGTVSPPHG